MVGMEGGMSRGVIRLVDMDMEGIRRVGMGMEDIRRVMDMGIIIMIVMDMGIRNIRKRSMGDVGARLLIAIRCYEYRASDELRFSFFSLLLILGMICGVLA